MFQLDTNGVTTLHPHIGDKRCRSQGILIRCDAVTQERQHVIRLWPLANARFTGSQSGVPSLTNRCTKWVHLSMTSKRLDCEGQNCVQQFVEVVLRFLRRGVSP